MTEDIKRALEVLKSGGVVLYPTDTMWSLGCDATNQEAVKKIFDIKKRNDLKSVHILLDNPGFLSYYVQVPDIAFDLIELTDKPLTIIYTGAKNLAFNLISQDGSIGISITNDNFCKQLISRFRKPIVCSAANDNGGDAPDNFDDISEEIKNAVDYIVEHRQDDYNNYQSSSIIKLGPRGEIEIIRK